MKKLTIFLVTVFCAIGIYAQELVGTWQGNLKVQGMELRLLIHVEMKEGAYTGTMDSPDQGATGIPINSMVLNDSVFTFEINSAGIKYEAIIKNDTLISGIFNQSGMALSLDLVKQELEIEASRRPQEPIPPYPYHSEDVKFFNEEANIELAGTFTYPKEGDNFPVVVLISGSGAQNRNEELMGHKPFLVLADHLTRKGIAVLRYDDRGTAESTGDFATATTLDLATDAEAAVQYLKSRKDVDRSKIGLIGHSEGGIIAPMLAQKKLVDFIVLLAGPGMKGSDLIVLQSKLIAEAYGVEEAQLKRTLKINEDAVNLILKSEDTDSLKAQLKDYFRNAVKENPSLATNEAAANAFVNGQVQRLSSAWMQFFLTYDPAPVLEKVTCPVLALNGENDLQVPPEENLTIIKKSLDKAGNKNFSTVVIPKLNHLFQECENGSPLEYSKIEQTFSPIALNAVSSWILETTK